ncbi:ABC transporter permease [Rubrobacter marinus]|uniref:Transport permease protein n=1 Tax=Rubrobacter marinus TaxID=2653852 RepID=A0A6G8PZR9_9ACTN|nr:ABC transporter permease [Rubrobacter marinus]QIN79723.1 ABC transporter permease [Rubrobacter marinus]
MTLLESAFNRSFRTLLGREILRFVRVWTQTLIPPLLTSLLYVVVFGVALGGRIREVDGVPYLQYILPGVALMSLITGAYMNTSTSVFDAKRERYIDDILISPMSDAQIALAYTLGGTLRGLIVGVGVFVVGMPFAGASVVNPVMLLLIAVTVAFTFSALGAVVGVVAARIDHVTFMTNVVIQPLAFLGGVFYSADMLPPALRVATLFNPIFYMVDAARYATLRASDTNPYPTLAIVAALAALAFAGAWWAINRGPNLRY